MVVPFGSALERRSRTTYRPTVTPEGSTHVDIAFTGTTSSFSRTASGKVAVAAVVRQQVFDDRLDEVTPGRSNDGAPPPEGQGWWGSVISECRPSGTLHSAAGQQDADVSDVDQRETVRPDWLPELVGYRCAHDRLHGNCHHALLYPDWVTSFQFQL